MEATSPGSRELFVRQPPPVAPPPAAWTPPPPAPPAADLVRQPLFHGSGSTLLGIHVVNVLLTLLTLGVYYFWGKTKVRRYVFSQTEIAGDRFAYHGTGRELLLGFMRAFLVFLLPLIVLSIIQKPLDVDANIKQAAGFLGSILFFVFIPVALVGARRYRLSRTSWRGIRFSFRGKAWRFILLFLKGSFLTGLTFGLYYPFFLTERQAFMISHSYFGSERFEFTGRGRDLFPNYLLALLLTFPTLGLCWVWFIARKRRFFWNHTSFGAARFRSTVSGGRLLGLYLVSGLLLVGTLGLAWSWVRVRNIRFAFRYLTLEGPVELERIEQQAQFASATGEGLAGFLDTGFDLG
jgi:uncharacterized membrane protein YjgN (DUF898 family)